MDLEDSFASLHIRARHDHPPIETAGPQEGGIEHVGAIGRRDQDHAFVGLEAVHLDQQLVERLLALVVTAAQAGAAMAPDGVDLIDKDDARRVLLALHEEVAHPRCAHADEHLDEVGAGDREERHPGLSRDRAGQQRLAGARRADQQHALGDSAAKAGEAFGVLEELDYLLELVLGLVDSGDVGERDFVGILGEKLGAALTERHRLAAADLHLPHEEDPHRHQQQHREPLHQRDHPPRISVLGLGRDLHAFVAQGLYQVLIAGRVGLEVFAAAGAAVDQAALDGDFADLVPVDLVQEVGEDDLRFARLLPAEDIEQQQEHQSQYQPQCDTARKLVHSLKRYHARLISRNRAFTKVLASR